MLQFRPSIALLAAIALSTSAAHAQELRMIELDAVAAISYDGTFIVGSDWTDEMYWSEQTGAVQIGDYPEDGSYYVRDVSNGGTRIVGRGHFWDHGHRGLWMEAAPSGTATLHPLLFGVDENTGLGRANAVSADGQVIVGTDARNWGPREAIVWTDITPEGATATFLGVPAGFISSDAFAINADGSVVVGRCITTQENSMAYVWTKNKNGEWTGARLGAIPGSMSSAATAVSGDGNVVIGQYSNSRGTGAFTWTRADGMQILSEPEPENDIAIRGINHDGSVIVGGYDIWINRERMYIRDYLASQGFHLSYWSSLFAWDVSGDGTIVGTGSYSIHPWGERTWLARIPAIKPCLVDFNIDGSVNSQDFFDFLVAFFASTPNADFNRDGAVNTQDFFNFISAFFMSTC